MHAAALRIELHVPDSRSLKDKRRVLRPFVEGLRRLASLSVAEVDHHDTWQRAAVAVAVVAPDAASLERLLERVRRYVDEQLELDVLGVETTYMEAPDG
ncbi:MAG TPA: DUF503 domain-containing protein [Acidimicrobiia bacterium]|nr:DUF503 domain-containing protein [Acidimicrobiia bacterium]